MRNSNSILLYLLVWIGIVFMGIFALGMLNCYFFSPVNSNDYAIFSLDVPGSPFLDLTVLSQSSIYANFSPPLTDGGSAISSYEVSVFFSSINPV